MIPIKNNLKDEGISEKEINIIINFDKLSRYKDNQQIKKSNA